MRNKFEYEGNPPYAMNTLNMDILDLLYDNESQFALDSIKLIENYESILGRNEKEGVNKLVNERSKKSFCVLALSIKDNRIKLITSKSRWSKSYDGLISNALTCDLYSIFVSNYKHELINPIMISLKKRVNYIKIGGMVSIVEKPFISKESDEAEVVHLFEGEYNYMNLMNHVLENLNSGSKP